jgi:hypothetical protein
MPSTRKILENPSRDSSFSAAMQIAVIRLEEQIM